MVPTGTGKSGKKVGEIATSEKYNLPWYSSLQEDKNSMQFGKPKYSCLFHLEKETVINIIFS